MGTRRNTTGYWCVVLRIPKLSGCLILPQATLRQLACKHLKLQQVFNQQVPADIDNVVAGVSVYNVLFIRNGLTQRADQCRTS